MLNSNYIKKNFKELNWKGDLINLDFQPYTQEDKEIHDLI